MTADDKAAGPKTDRPGDASTTRIPEYPRGGDPRRRGVLRERLYLRRRNARAFDAAAGRYGDELISSPMGEEINSDPCADWWFDIGMTLTVEERERAGGCG